MRRLAWLLAFLAASCVAQQTQQVQQQQVQREGGAAAERSKRPSPEQKANQERARQMLETTEAEARAFEPPMRALTLWHIATGVTPLDRKHAIVVLHDAFLATTEIEESSDAPKGPGGDKQFLQQRILADLLKLDEAAVLDVLPQAEPQVRLGMMASIAERAAQRKDFYRAVDLLNQLAADTTGEFPYNAAIQVMLALPPERDAERQNIFMQSLGRFRNPDEKSVNRFRMGDDFESMVVRFANRLPKDVVLSAVTEVFKQAKARDEANGVSLSLMSDAGSASFNSYYDYVLFEMLPILRRLDPGQAESLLRDHTQLTPVMDKYPNGMQSLDPTMRDTPKKPGEHSNIGMSISSNSKKGSGGGAPAAGVNQNQQLAAQYRTQVARIVADAATDPRQATAEALALPNEIGWSHPRCEALEQIARANVEKHPAAAKNAVDELLKNAEALDAGKRSQFVAQAANLYLKLDDKDAARKAVNRLAETAVELYEKDSDRDDPNTALKGYWPSASTWRLAVILGTRISPQAAEEILAGIKDDEIRTSERVAYAVALAGGSFPSNTTMERHKNGQNSTMMNDMPQ